MDGHPLCRSDARYGDEIGGVVRWDGDRDLGSLAGQAVRLRFILKDADLYVFKFDEGSR